MASRSGIGGSRLAGVAAATLALAAFALHAPARAETPPVRDPDFRLVSPSTSTAVPDPRPEIRVEIRGRRGPAALFLDGVDVTALAVREPGSLSYRPAASLSPGPHRVRLALADDGVATELDWAFTVGGPTGGGRGEVYARGGVSLTGGGAVAETGLRDRLAANGNLALDTGVRVGGVEASLAGNVRYVHGGAAPEVAPTGFLATLRAGGNALQLGDVTFDGTPYTAPVLARRGLLARAEHEAGRLQLFQVRSSTVTGLDAGVRFRDDSDQVYGGSVSSAFFAANPLRVTAAFIQGRSVERSSNVATTEGPSAGRTAGLAISGGLLGASFAAEGAWSAHDAETRDAPGATHDTAASLRLSRPAGPVHLSGAYERVGASFASIANPNGTRDRQTFGASAATSVGVATVSASASRSNDNVGGDGARPVVVNTAGGATLTLAPSRWPRLTLSYLHGVLGARSVPTGQPGVDSVTDTGTVAAQVGSGAWTGTVSSNLSRLEDRLADATSRTQSHQLLVTVQPGPSLRVAPGLGWTESRASGVARRTALATLTLGAALPAALAVAAQGSAVRTTVSDGSLETWQWNGALRLGLQLHELYRRWLAYGQQVLAVSVTYDRLRDVHVPARGTERYAAFVTLNLFLPVDGRATF